MDRILELTQKFVRIPSVNPMGGPDDDPIYSEKNVADLVFELLDANGARPTRQGTEKHPNVVARIEQQLAQTLLLTAHTDTVSHENMTISPFDPVIQGRQALRPWIVRHESLAGDFSGHLHRGPEQSVTAEIQFGVRRRA